MEGKKAFEDAGPTLRSFSPRLPTPDASRSSDTSTDTRRGPTVSDLLSFKPAEDSRPDSQNNTPPYEERRPLLPPLKMVIASAMTSPPETPRIHRASLQPSPREPSVTTFSFKPLAFYPNKKARTEDHPQWQASNARVSPTAEHSIPSSYPGFTRRLSDPSNKRHRRYSMHPYASARCYDSDQKSYYTYGARPGSSGTTSTPRFESTRERTCYERFPISPTSDTSYGRSETIPYRTTPIHVESRPYTLLPAPSPEYEQASTGAFRRHAPEMFGHRGFEDYGCRESCHSSHGGAFFVPPHYDYSQGKSRKRSNLPKQSTEIMKTWFDNNIANPYPSEEQKALFSNATGISMTQVSNWFINHRRRCPELREKRERVRTGGALET